MVNSSGSAALTPSPGDIFSRCRIEDDPPPTLRKPYLPPRQQFLAALAAGLQGKMFGDKGYISKEM